MKVSKVVLSTFAFNDIEAAEENSETMTEFISEAAALTAANASSIIENNNPAVNLTFKVKEVGLALISFDNSIDLVYDDIKFTLAQSSRQLEAQFMLRSISLKNSNSNYDIISTLPWIDKLGCENDSASMDKHTFATVTFKTRFDQPIKKAIKEFEETDFFIDIKIAVHGRFRMVLIYSSLDVEVRCRSQP